MSEPCADDMMMALILSISGESLVSGIPIDDIMSAWDHVLSAEQKQQMTSILTKIINKDKDNE